MGEWEWEYISCYGISPYANGEDFKGLTIEFNSDNTLDIKEDGQLSQTSRWEVISTGNDFFAIEVAPFVSQLSGVILFCGEKVAFISSIGDGCDHYFTRK